MHIRIIHHSFCNSETGIVGHVILKNVKNKLLLNRLPLADTEEALREYAEREGLAEEEVDPEDRLVKEMIAQGKKNVLHLQ